MVWSQRAICAVAAFDLEGRMGDAESGLHAFGSLSDEAVVRCSYRHKDVACQCCLGRAHRPDVQIVNCRDA